VEAAQASRGIVSTLFAVQFESKSDCFVVDGLFDLDAELWNLLVVIWQSVRNLALLYEFWHEVFHIWDWGKGLIRAETFQSLVLM